MRFRLLDEDSEEINELLRQFKKTKKGLLPLLKINSASILGRKLAGYGYLNQDELDIIYEYLDRKESVSYLLNYEDRLRPPKLIDHPKLI